MEAIKIAKWFLNLNPSLGSGCNDGNTKLNELLYYSNLMFYSVKGKNLIDEPFEESNNGPIIKEVCNDLNCTDNLCVDIEDKEILQMLYIVDFAYDDLSARKLPEENYKSDVWQGVEKNKYIDFSNIDEKEKKLMLILYMTYADFDFQNLVTKKLGGNKFYYDKRDIQLTDELISYLEDLPSFSEPMFLEIVNGELVFS